MIATGKFSWLVARRFLPAKSAHCKNRGPAWRRAPALAGLLLAVLLAWPTVGEAVPLRRQGQNPRSLAMGGTGLSFANDEMALFYNPAGLGAIDTYWFEILPISIGVSADALAAGSGTDTSSADTAALVSDNLGKEIRVRAFGYPNAVFNLQPGVTLGMAYFQEVTVEMMIRNMATPEIQAFVRQDEGTAVGISFPLYQGQMLAGIGMRQFTRTGAEGTISTAALAVASGGDGGLDLEAELGASTGSGTAYDLGMIWRMETFAAARGQFAFVIHNFGGVSLKDEDGVVVDEVPQEVSMGWSFRPNFALPTLMAIEFRDLLQGLSSDGSIGKRTHFGIEVGLLRQDDATNLLTFRGGYHAGAPSYGVEISFWHGFSLQYVEFYEEYGDAAGEDSRKRQLIQILIGF